MGQRANYIIKETGAITLYYNHWRANAISTDLYLIRLCTVGSTTMPRLVKNVCSMVKRSIATEGTIFFGSSLSAENQDFFTVDSFSFLC